MPIDSVNSEYHVDTFINMQTDLGGYLKEGATIEGEWAVEDKKRAINRGCVAVAAATLTTKRVFNYTVEGKPSPDQMQELTIPNKLITPMRLFIDGQEYKEKTFDQWLDQMGNYIEPPAGQIKSATTQSNVALRMNRFFYWDEAKNVFLINPSITDTKSVQLYAIAMPRLLVNDEDVTDLNPIFSHLPAKWAAWHLLYKDEEHRDRGLAARRDYHAGLKDFEKFKKNRKGNISKSIIKDQSQFGTHDTLNAGGRADLGDYWDRLP